MRYSNDPVVKPRSVGDLLPTPEELALMQENVKVTIKLSRSSVEFFKQMAHKHHIPYQKMIRTLIDSYAATHQSQ